MRSMSFLAGAAVALASVAAGAAHSPAPSLFAAFGDVTYLDDEATGAITVVADPAGGTSATPEIVALTTQPGTGVVYGLDVGDIFDVNPGATQLLTFDQAGKVSSSTRVTYQGNDVQLAEGLSFAPNGDLWVSFHVDETNFSVSGHLGIIDPATGVVRASSVVLLSGGTQNDGDALEFVGNTLIVSDNLLSLGTTLFTVNRATGALTAIGPVADAAGNQYEIAELAWDGRTLWGESFTGNGSGTTGRLLQINTGNARATVVGPAGGREILDGLTVANIGGGGGGGGCDCCHGNGKGHDCDCCHGNGKGHDCDCDHGNGKGHDCDDDDDHGHDRDRHDHHPSRTWRH